MSEELDLESMPLDKLKSLALENNAELPDEQARDEKGQFVKAEPQAEPEEVDAIVYRREIDLGDGSGRQVFEADTLDGLVDKLASAQEHATRKIRELSTKRPEPVVEKLDPNQEWLLSQELIATPTETFKKMFEKTVGMPIDAFKTRTAKLEAFEQAQTEEANGRAFLAKHPEFVQNSANASRMERYIRTYKLEGTPENIEQAYKDLSDSGLLELKSEEDVDGAQRIAEARPVAARKVASGISSKRSSTVNRAQEPTEEDLYSMPLDKLRSLALKEGGQS